MASSVEEVLALCVEDVPEGIVELENGVEVEVKALTGSQSARVSSMQYMDDRILFALPKGIVKPRMTTSQVQTLLDKAPKQATKILVKIFELSGVLVEAEAGERKDAEKN